MCRELQELNQKNGFPITPPPFLFPSTTSNTLDYQKQPNFSSSFEKISPILLLITIILAAIFFISGLLHLLLRYFNKRPSFSPVFNSNRFPDSSGSRSLRRQLQQLFRQHDSGLDQASLDSLPVFYYKDIIGLNEPFDCAVCLCEFIDNDKLRLLPVCGHAFHIDCIDTWLLSNSTCPICRRSLLSSISPLPVENSRRFRHERLSNQSVTQTTPATNMILNQQGQNVIRQNTINEEIDDHNSSNLREKRVFSIRLGKFRSSNEGQGESSRCNMDARRCYSMGTLQYVVGDSSLLVALPDNNSEDENQSVIQDNNIQDKKIKGRTRGDSFSVSKIWLWSKNSRIPSSCSRFDINVSSFLDVTEVSNHI